MVNQKGDTSICFTINESRILLKKINRLSLCDTNLSICESQLKFQDSVSEKNNRIISILKEDIKTNKELTDLCNSKVISLELEIQKQKKEVKRQKIQKIIGVLAGAFTTSLTTYLWITK